MTLRLIQFVCAIALVAAFSPLRSCVLESLALGDSCHTESTAGGESNHESSCTCDAPKDSTKASKPVLISMTPMILPAILNPFESRVQIADYSDSTSDPPPISSRQIPLLL